MGESPLVRVSKDFKKFLEEFKKENNASSFPDATNHLLRDLRRWELKEEEKEDEFKMSFFR